MTLVVIMLVVIIMSVVVTMVIVSIFVTVVIVSIFVTMVIVVVMVIVSIFVTVVMMVMMCSAHLQCDHVECLLVVWMVGLKFEDVLAFFKFVDVDYCSIRAVLARSNLLV